jgi:hypothetical protein
MDAAETRAFDLERSIRKFRYKINKENRIVEFCHQVREGAMGRLAVKVMVLLTFIFIDKNWIILE